MAFATSTLAPDLTTDATFRAFCTGISNKLSAMGLIKETVAGEINLATVTKPSGGGGPGMGEPTWQGFQIWKLNDTLQATAPFFMKIQYGSGGTYFDPEVGEVPTPGIGVSFGTSFTGGTLGAQSVAEKLMSFQQSADAKKCVWSGANNRFCCALFHNFANGYGWLSFERTRDSSGADTGEGLLIFGGNGTYQKWQVVLPSSGGIPTYETDYGCIAPTQGTGVRGVEVALYRLIPFLGKTLRPARGCFAYFNSDVTAESIVTASVDGADMSVYCVGNQPANIARGNTNTRLALRYE